MLVKELIVSPVTTCTVDSDIAKARDLMTLKNISALPVVQTDGEKISLQGIVSYHDLAGVYDDTINIQQVMSTKIYAVTPETTAKDAAKVMIDKKIHHLIVIDGEEIAGIISSFDFVKLVADK